MFISADLPPLPVGRIHTDGGVDYATEVVLDSTHVLDDWSAGITTGIGAILTLLEFFV